MKSKVKKPTVTIEATVTRADGTVENLGIIAETKKQNIFRKFLGGRK